MTIDEIKTLKKEAENNILTIIENFEKRTELSVQSIHLDKLTTCSDDRSKVSSAYMKVTLGGE